MMASPDAAEPVAPAAPPSTPPTSGETARIEGPLEPGSEVALGCPSCNWRSEPATVYDQPNGTWHALSSLGYEYRRHADMNHRLPAVRLVFVTTSCGDAPRSTQ
jgi:hypothetical protein